MERVEKNSIDASLTRLVAPIDPESSVAVSVQLRGALEYGIATGDIPANTRLPSIRRLAAHLNLSPVTVSNVYAALQERGHIEGRLGSGTFVADRAPMPASQAQRLAAFEQQIAEVLEAGRRLGLSRQDVAFRLSMAAPAPVVPVRVLVLGTFPDATQAYANDLRPHLRETDTVIAASVEDIKHGVRPDVDLVFCPHTLTPEAARLFPALPVVGMTLIPNETTRIALASIPPEARAWAVSYYDDFLSALKSGLDRFAAHVNQITAVPRDFDGLAEILPHIDVLIFSTGAEYLRAGLRSDQTAIEYRHTPDSRAIRSELLPAIENARAKRRTEETRDENK